MEEFVLYTIKDKYCNITLFETTDSDFAIKKAKSIGEDNVVIIKDTCYRVISKND